MTFTLRVRPAADLDIDEAVLYIMRDSAEQSARFYGAVEVTYHQIRMRPHAWPRFIALEHPRLSTLRHRPVVGFPNHLVVYRIDDDVVLVLRILHAARDLPAVLARDIEPEPE